MGLFHRVFVISTKDAAHPYFAGDNANPLNASYFPVQCLDLVTPIQRKAVQA